MNSGSVALTTTNNEETCIQYFEEVLPYGKDPFAEISIL